MTNTLETYQDIVRKAGAIGQCFDDATKDLDLPAIAEKLGIRNGALFRALEKAHKEGRVEYRKKFWVIRYTTAPVDYDWMGTEDLGVAGHDKSDGKPWRKVRIDPDYVDGQADRYASGLKPCVSPAEWDKLIGYELVKPVELTAKSFGLTDEEAEIAEDDAAYKPGYLS